MRKMAKASRRAAVKTLTINKNRDFVVDRMLKPCEEGNHSRCTGWAVLKKGASEVNANYFLKCTCSCHKKQSQAKQIKQVKRVKRKQLKAVKKKAKKKLKRKVHKKKSKRTRRR